MSTLQTVAIKHASSLSNNISLATDGSLTFAVNTATIGTAAYFVANGNLGIGTSSPGAKLDVVSSGLLFRIASSTSSGYALSQFGQAATASQNWHIGSEGDGTFRFYNGNFGAGTERARITSDGDLQFNSGYGSVATAYGCRAWVYFNGTGTVAINASGNITSITDNGVGTYTVNFTNAMPNANYCVCGTASNNDNNRNESVSVSYGSTGTYATTAVTIWTTENTGSSTIDVDSPRISVAIFR